MKKLLCLMSCICAIAMFCAFSVCAVSVGANEAVKLQMLNLYVDEDNIADTDYNVDGVPTRLYTIVQVVYMLGVQSDALNQGLAHPFTDVPAWASSYVGYAYANGITSGVSATKFDPNGEVAETQFITFMLRTIGYDDRMGDFVWNNPYTLAKTAGLTDSETPDTDFTRGDAFVITYNALSATMKGGGQLKDVLIDKGVFTAEKYATVSTMNCTEHVGGEPIITATCTIDGVTEIKCIYCARVISSIATPAFGHSMEETVLTAPTTSAVGQLQRKCTTCGHTEYEEIPMLEIIQGDMNGDERLSLVDVLILLKLILNQR